MKAVFIERHGGPEVLKYAELPDPVPKLGEIVADVHAASVNAADWKVRTGGSLYVQAQFPHVLGRDFSGVVSAVGEGVAGFCPGDAVFAVCDVGQEGAYAETRAKPMSAYGTKRTTRIIHLMSAFGGIADIGQRRFNGS